MSDTEDIYLELYNYIIEKATEEEMNIVDEIKGLKKINIITEDVKENARNGSESIRKINLDNNSESNISKSISRKMTSKEMLIATLEILRSYLVVIPMLEKQTIKLLGQDNADNIKWVTEDNDDDGFELSKLNCYDSNELDDILKSLSKISGEVEHIGSQR